MQKQKFTDKDRKLIVDELEKIQKVKLNPINHSRNLFIDENGSPFLLIDGRDDWHGITENSMNRICNFDSEGVFVVIKKYRTKMDVYVGSLSLFVANIDKLILTSKGDYQFHCKHVKDGLYIREIPELFCNKVTEFYYPEYKDELVRTKELAKIISKKEKVKISFTHSDLQGKLLLIGSYLNYRTYTPDIEKNSIYGKLGDLCSEKVLPTDCIPLLSIDAVKYIDVIWFDDEGYPTHAFEVEHTTDITKGLLRLYQLHKLHIRLFIIADEEKRTKYNKEITKSPFSRIKQEYIFKNYQELDEFYKSVKNFSQCSKKFLKD
jgi:hypothetical protein